MPAARSAWLDTLARRLLPWAWLWACPAGAASAGAEHSYQFDAKLFRAGAISAQTLARFNQPDAVQPGLYALDVYLNQRFIKRLDIDFAVDAHHRVVPCITRAQWETLGVDPMHIRQTDIAQPHSAQPHSASTQTSAAAPDSASLPPTPATCPVLTAHVAGAVSQLDMSRLRLALSVPQIALLRTARGRVNPADLEAGQSIFFVNYIGNAHHVNWAGGDRGDQRSLFFGVAGGVNLGAWQFRQQGSFSKATGERLRWQSLRSYLQRPIAQLGSQLTLGQHTTNGRFFSGLSYTGLGLETDVRMRADSQRGYAPTVQGVAHSTAQVSISQNGQIVYQTSVPPGAFIIDDLYPTAYNGDLHVEVLEADGSMHSFDLPFAAVPESLRPGVSRYQFALGRTRGEHQHNSLFADVSAERGLTNSLTANGGLRVADHYQALVAGGVHASRYGALGLNLTYSRAQLPRAGWLDGWMANLSYGRSFAPTGTHVTLAGYRYSSRGYRDLSDVLGVRYARARGQGFQSARYKQRTRLEASISQSLGDYGSLHIAGSSQYYRDGRGRDSQWQLGYSTSWSNGMSLNLSFIEQRTRASPIEARAGHGEHRTQKERVIMLSVAAPLGQRVRALEARPGARVNASYGFSHSAQSGSQQQSSVTGTLDEAQTVNYSLGASRSSRSRRTGQASWNASLGKRLPTTHLNFSAAGGPKYWQVAANAQGALAIHAGGVTLGAYLGDTFALVHAPGAHGAQLVNAQGARIDRLGYALVPALTPYRYNRILLDPRGMADDIELQDGEQRVAPIAGATLKVHFRTQSGRALLIRVRRADGADLPLGTEAYNTAGEAVGMVGHAGLLYARTPEQQGELRLRWGEAANEQCRLPYDSRARLLPNEAAKVPANAAPALLRLEATCYAV